MDLRILSEILDGNCLTILIAGACLGVFGGILGQRTKWLRTIIRFAIYGACELLMMQTNANILVTPAVIVGTYALGSGIGYLLAALAKSTGKKKKKKDK